MGGLALCSLANISSTSIARDLSTEVIKLLSHSNAYIRKKATLCAIRIVRKVPELLEQFVPKVRPMLVERNHGVLITAVSLMIEMCRADPDRTIRPFKRAAPQLVKVLKNLVSSGYAPEHDVNGITDPFLQVKVLCLLRILGKGDAEISDSMNDILAQVATNTDSSRNVGNAILYECVQTIMSIESESGLRVLAINILGRFLMNKDNNIRYVALNTLTRVVNIDHQAVQRHRQTVVECLKDHDSSIRKRALDLTYALVNKSNIKVLVKELLNYLIAADIEFRGEITAQICLLTERYAPTPRWHIDTILRVMNSRAGGYVQPETVSNIIQLVQDTPDIQAYAVHKLYAAILKDITCQALVRTAVWVIGEFGDLLLAGGRKDIVVDDVLDLLATILRHPASDLETREMTMTAMLKLTDRLQSDEMTQRFKEMIEPFRSSLTLELQQRACEYYNVVSSMPEEKRADLLEHMPAREREESVVDDDDDESYPEPEPAQQEQLISLVKQPEAPGDLLKDILGGGNPAPTPAPSAPANNTLIDLLGGGSSAPPPSTGSGLADLLGGTSGPAPSSISPVSSPYGSANQPPANVPVHGSGQVPSLSPAASPYGSANQPSADQIPPIVAFEKSGVKVTFRFQKNPEFPQVTLIESSVTNASPFELTNFSIQAAVPQYMKVQLSPASGNNVPHKIVVLSPNK